MLLEILLSGLLTKGRHKDDAYLKLKEHVRNMEYKSVSGV